MKSEALGIATSAAEVTNISPHGLWLLIESEELFLPFDEFPWFRDAPISAVLHVERPFPDHFHWPELHIDLVVRFTKILPIKRPCGHMKGSRVLYREEALHGTSEQAPQDPAHRGAEK